jgi:hypothetical protein
VQAHSDCPDNGGDGNRDGVARVGVQVGLVAVGLCLGGECLGELLTGARYGAGRCTDIETAGPADIAAAIASEIGRDVAHLPVATDGAARAAAMIADLP